jgi:hypothetical protein
MLGKQISLNALWRSAPVSDRNFQPDARADLPNPARRYLKHAIAPGTKLASAVRLRMHGEIKLKNWYPFRAEQVICWNRGTIWQATAWMNRLPISGWDRLIDGKGAMQWKLLGLFPVMTATGSDVTRSAIGRMQGECVWLPSVFCDRNVQWTASDDFHAHAHLTLLDETTELRFAVSETGRLEQFCFKRWGNPEGAEHHYADFGGYVEEEGTFSGYTIPTRLRIGWYFGSERFESEGEFFRVAIDEAIYTDNGDC